MRKDTLHLILYACGTVMMQIEEKVQTPMWTRLKKD